MATKGAAVNIVIVVMLCLMAFGIFLNVFCPESGGMFGPQPNVGGCLMCFIGLGVLMAIGFMILGKWLL